MICKLKAENKEEIVQLNREIESLGTELDLLKKQKKSHDATNRKFKSLKAQVAKTKSHVEEAQAALDKIP